MERASGLLMQVPEYKLEDVIEFLQGIVSNEAEIPNETTLAAFREGEEMLRTGKGERFRGSAEEYFALLDLDLEDDA